MRIFMFSFKINVLGNEWWCQTLHVGSHGGPCWAMLSEEPGALLAQCQGLEGDTKRDAFWKL